MPNKKEEKVRRLGVVENPFDEDFKPDKKKPTWTLPDAKKIKIEDIMPENQEVIFVPVKAVYKTKRGKKRVRMLRSEWEVERHRLVTESFKSLITLHEITVKFPLVHGAQGVREFREETVQEPRRVLDCGCYITWDSSRNQNQVTKKVTWSHDFHFDTCQLCELHKQVREELEKRRIWRNVHNYRVRRERAKKAPVVEAIEIPLLRQEDWKSGEGEVGVR
jgi:hypothetical protein